MSGKKLNKTKKDLTSFVHNAWTVSSLAKILKNSLEYGSNIRKVDILYLAGLLDEILEKQKSEISGIKKNLFGL